MNFFGEFMAVEEKKFVEIGQLKEGGYVLIDGIACQIKSFDKSKPGKHGAAKARIVAVGVFNAQKKNLLKPVSAEAEVPIIKKGTAQVVAVMGEVVQIMDTTSYETFDVKKPKEIEDLQSGTEIEYNQYGSELMIVRKR